MLFLVGCASEKPWENAKEFEKSISCSSTIEEIKELGKKLNGQVKEEKNKNTEIHIFKGYDYYISYFENNTHTLKNISKQKIETWYFGLFPETVGFKSVIDCE